MPVAALQPGQEVAAAVLDAGGRVLLPAGTILSEAAIASLGRREIAAIAVVVEVEEDPAATAARRERVIREVDQVFRRAGEGAATRAMYEAILAHRLERHS